MFSVSTSALLGPFEAQAAQRLAERRVSLRKRVTDDRKRIGERAAHSDLLRSLSGEDERDHLVTWWLGELVI